MIIILRKGINQINFYKIALRANKIINQMVL
jgi:hypothetical protein